MWKENPTYLEGRYLAHGGKSLSSLVPCLVSTALPLLSNLPSPPSHPLAHTILQWQHQQFRSFWSGTILLNSSQLLITDATRAAWPLYEEKFPDCSKSNQAVSAIILMRVTIQKIRESFSGITANYHLPSVNCLDPLQYIVRYLEAR